MCLQCIIPYHMNSGRCILNCPNGTYLNTITNQCMCSSSCIYCASNSSCLFCTASMYLYMGNCYTVCPTGTMPSTDTITNSSTVYIRNICIFNPCATTITTASTYNCTSCLNPYLLYSYQCVLTCPNSTYQSLSSRTC
jgi:proprotein convertase subtilisin/kexin type 5